MVRALAKAKRVGGSIMVRLPKEVVQQEDIHEGEMIELDVKKARRQWFGVTPQISEFTHEDELENLG
jgi:antitoxin component of MazEF toxin-antitoxin module